LDINLNGPKASCIRPFFKLLKNFAAAQVYAVPGLVWSLLSTAQTRHTDRLVVREEDLQDRDNTNIHNHINDF